MRRVLLACLTAGVCIATADAQDASPAQAPEPASMKGLDAVVVHGVQPGPELWKVTKGDHVLWILGTLSPMPKDIAWDSSRVEVLIAGSQEVVTGPEAELKSNAGIFATLAVLPSLIGVRDNPDGKTLKDVLPPDLYARWLPLKQKYIGDSNKAESWRPIFAALELFDDAIRKSGLTDKLIVQKAVEAAAKHAGVRITTPRVTVSVDSPRAAVKEFKATALDDTECFRKTLDRIDSDLGTMKARANAWSTGDLDALRKLPYTEQMSACVEAVSAAQLGQTMGVEGISARARHAWLDAASAALEKNQSSFAMLPITRLLNPDGGYLASLRSKGYVIEAPAPKAQAAAGTAPPDSAAK